MSKLKPKLKQIEIWNYWFPNYRDYGLKIVENAGIILGYIRGWLLPLLMSKRLVISKYILIGEYQNQLSFNDNERIKGILLNHKIVP